MRLGLFWTAVSTAITIGAMGIETDAEIQAEEPMMKIDDYETWMQADVQWKDRAVRVYRVLWYAFWTAAIVALTLYGRFLVTL